MKGLSTLPARCLFSAASTSIILGKSFSLLGSIAGPACVLFPLIVQFAALLFSHHCCCSPLLSLFSLLLYYSSFFFSLSFPSRQRRRHFNSFMILLARSSFSFALIFLRLLFSPLLSPSLPLLLSLRVPHFVVTQIELSRPLAHLLEIGIFNAARTLHHPSLFVADAHSNDAHTLPVAGIAYF